MSPFLTFSYGLGLLIMLGWYFATDSEVRKRNLGTLLTVLLIIFCLINIYPPFDVKDPKTDLVTYYPPPWPCGNRFAEYDT